MGYCRKCGAKVDDLDAFCGNCGAHIERKIRSLSTTMAIRIIIKSIRRPTALRMTKSPKAVLTI